MLLKFEHRWRNRELALPGSHRREALPLANRIWQIFATSVFQSGLGIEKIHLRRGSGLEQINDPFGFGLVVDSATLLGLGCLIAAGIAAI